MKPQYYKYLLPLSLLLLLIIVIFYYVYQPLENKHLQNMAQQQMLSSIEYKGSVVIKKKSDFSANEITTLTTAAGTYDLVTMAENITAEALQAFSTTNIHSLPLVSHENTKVMDPMSMINRISNGEHILVTWQLDPYYNNSLGLNYYESSIKKAAELGLPLVFVLPAPESALTKDPFYFNLSQEENANEITTDGIILPKLSPFGPTNKWKEIGTQWTSTSLMEQLQLWYPNPPLVLFVSQDIANQLSWDELENSARYVASYPAGKSDHFKRTLVGAAWIEKYRQLHEGFKTGLTNATWKQNIRFITNNQFSVNMGENSNWIQTATETNQYTNLWPLTADGTRINFELNMSNNDNTVNSPHFFANNLPFMLEEAKFLNPHYTKELNINTKLKTNDLDRYRGLTQFALWFLRPNFISQTSEETTQETINPLFQEIVNSVELIQNNDQLANFWQNAKLVANGETNLNINIPDRYKNTPRWFLLDVDANPPRPWTKDTTINVWAFALVKGETPNREWLIYVQSPENNLTNINLKVPSYGDITVDSSQKGNFYILKESSLSIENISSKADSNKTGKNTIPINIEGAINVKDYGAVGDGLSDDYNAIILAEKAGRKLYFPAGTYNISKMWYVNKDTSLIYGEGKIVCNFVHSVEWPAGALIIKETNDLTIDGLSFEWKTNKNANYGGVIIFGYSNKPIANVTIQNSKFYNPTLHNSVAIGATARNENEGIHNFKVYNCYFHNFITTPLCAVGLQKPNMPEVPMYNFEFIANKMVLDSGIDTTGSALVAAISLANSAHDIVFSNNYVSGYTYGIENSGVYNVTTTYNTFENTYNPLFINDNGGDHVSHDNYYAYNIMSNKISPEGVKIFTRGSTNSIFEYNTIYGHVEFEQGSNVIFRHNKVISSTNKGINLAYTNNYLIENNYIESTNNTYNYILTTYKSLGTNVFKKNIIKLKGNLSYTNIEKNDLLIE